MTTRSATRACSTPTEGARSCNGTPSSSGSVRRPRRSAARSTSVPWAGFEMVIEVVSGSIARSASCGCSPNRLSSRLASSAARTGPSRYVTSMRSAEPRPAWRRSRSAGPAASAVSRAGSSSGLAPRSRPVTRSTPRGPISRIDRATRLCATGSTAAAASSRVIPPTSTPEIVVPAGIVLRSDRAMPPRTAATTTRTPARTSATKGQRRRR